MSETEAHVHRYPTTTRWSGSTAVGYADYDRTHQVVCPPVGQPLTLSSDPAFLGAPDELDPERLLVAAASSCQLLSFLAVAARARIDVIAYVDDALGEMPDDGRPMAIERITLRPTVTIRGQASEERLRKLTDLAHRECFIANSLRSAITIEPTFAFVD